MSRQSIFDDEWRACLREQYMYVIRTQDKVTERTLIKVMHQVGFGEDELAELRVQATMRVEDMPDDFVPDMDVLAEEPSVHAVSVPDSSEKNNDDGDEPDDSLPLPGDDYYDDSVDSFDENNVDDSDASDDFLPLPGDDYDDGSVGTRQALSENGDVPDDELPEEEDEDDEGPQQLSMF